MRQLADSVRHHYSPNLYKIKSRIETGDPFAEKILQFADFFAYAPHIKLVTNGEKERRFEEIKHKYYNFDGSWRERGFVVIDEGDSLGYRWATPIAFHAGGTVFIVRLIII